MNTWNPENYKTYWLDWQDDKGGWWEDNFVMARDYEDLLAMYKAKYGYCTTPSLHPNEAIPLYRIPLPVKATACMSPQTTVTGLMELTWRKQQCYLRPNTDQEYFYVCEQGVYATGDWKTSSTPVFSGRVIPNFVLEWMHKYAEVFQIGMAYAASRK